MDVKLKYEKEADITKQVDLADYLLHTYVKANAVSELNLDGKARSAQYKFITQQIEKARQFNCSLDNNMFEMLIRLVEMDLLDPLARFVLTDEYLQFKKKQTSFVNKLRRCWQ